MLQKIKDFLSFLRDGLRVDLRDEYKDLHEAVRRATINHVVEIKPTAEPNRIPNKL